MAHRLTAVLVLALAVGSIALSLSNAAQEAAVGTPAANSDPGGGWSWVALVSFYVALVALGPTITAWWIVWRNRDDRDR